MEDLNAKIAARRQELARQEQQQKVADSEAKAAQRDAVVAERHDVVARVAAEMTAGGVSTSAEKGKLALVALPAAPLDVAGLKRSAVERLVKREARRLWTPFENWLVIGLIVAGVCLVPLLLIGLIPITIGLAVRDKLNKRYRGRVRERVAAAITT